MKVTALLKDPDRTRFSLEVYPPKPVRTPNGPTLQQHLSNIFETVEHLLCYDPAFVSVTYNPEGMTRATSIPVAAIIKQRFKLEALAHLTSFATSWKELKRTIDVIDYFNIENVLALRGDIPKNPPPKDILHPAHACDLVAGIKKYRKGFCIGVAGYPEGHPECKGPDGKVDLAQDLKNFKVKVDHGAEFAITQLFLDNDVYFDFVNRAAAAGVKVPILPGILPMINANSAAIVSRLGASVPPALKAKLESNKGDLEELQHIGVEHAVRQCKGLLGKTPCIHFYTMDRWEAVDAILKQL
jgi:methylenetetrahydrofolate reductase (NADPH)